jgi:transposase
VRADDHAAVLKIWSERHRDLGRTRTQVVCRLHAVLGELIPGGVPRVITVARAGRVLKAIRGEGAVDMARRKLAAAFLDDLGRIDAQMRETSKQLAAVVAATGTSLTGLFGSARSSPPLSSATSATSPASPAGTTSPPTTGPRRSRCPPTRARSTG